MALFQKKIGPVFLKEESDATGFINRMIQLEEQVTDINLKNEINKQIKLASIGEVGEKNISFELKNSGMDMYVLHDIYLEIGDLSAQIDYIVITRKMVFVIECKNLIGDIEISDWKVGDLIMHDVFGKGVVVKVDGNFLKIAFSMPHGIKTLKAQHKAIKRLIN